MVVIAGDRADAERLRDEAAAVLLPMGLRLSPEKTVIVHIDQGFDFLGVHIQRHQQWGSEKRYVYTYPSRAALGAVKSKVRSATRQSANQTLAVLLHRLNPVLRGWTTYHRHGASSMTFNYLHSFVWRRVICWLRHKYDRANWKELRRRHLRGWWPTQDGVSLFNPGGVTITRYRYRGKSIPSPWVSVTREPIGSTAA